MSEQRYLTAHLPGCGGVIKQSPDDFIVTEIPAYEPCGSGEHLYLTIEKRGLTTLEAIRLIARSLSLPEREIGYAGMKDSVGVTRQTISVPRIRPEEVAGLSLKGVQLISALRHTNKLKLGHLKGNRFNLVVRSVNEGALAAASAILKVLVERGVPNRFGYQRYGVQGNSHLIGAAMLRGDWKGAVDLLMGDPQLLRDDQWRSAIQAYQRGDVAEALRLLPRHCDCERSVLQRLVSRPGAWEKAFGAVHPRLRKLYLSAYQSSLFDRVVEERLDRIDRVMEGDLAWKHVNGACFLVEDQEQEQPRAERFEISPSGPMFGTKMMQPQGEPRNMEERILAEEGLTLDSFGAQSGVAMEGQRRALRVPLGNPSCSQEGSSLCLEFFLPKGSYATSVLREITKNF
ncbi:tRNA pseudouridine(13) synthase TruD [Pelobacter propionicus]|uniref:tRNA pseudouridine synthase D n=1 Tax=Pelobacter propionicus (strain DSM 2379 / NBRC 103807 / OttBd1) TaxID=338966 RepID=A1APP4_PELPD|nr:tRNA pseudouridine(13) synthase TruD [Pelobacter propionicus]ABK99314.1 Pseudouridylate synthase [Pelobacter propionicus DSM 2379]